MIFVGGREYFRPLIFYNQFDMTNKFSSERKAVARLLVDMLYERRSSTRNLRWIYSRYAKYLFGVSFETFSSYLDRDNDPLDVVELPPYIVLGLWAMVNVPCGEHRYPAELRRLLSRPRYAKSKSRKRCARHTGADLPRRGRENDEEREAERKIVEEVAV